MKINSISSIRKSGISYVQKQRNKLINLGCYSIPCTKITPDNETMKEIFKKMRKNFYNLTG